MTTFYVKATRIDYHEAYVAVEADNEEEAIEKLENSDAWQFWDWTELDSDSPSYEIAADITDPNCVEASVAHRNARALPLSEVE